MKRFIFSFVLLIPFYTGDAFAQSDELNNKYWSLRERFRKHFVNIGHTAGQSLTISKIHPYKYCQNSKGAMIDFGDVMAFQGDYLAVLCSEYYLLTHDRIVDSTRLTAVENELYFAVNAVPARRRGCASATSCAPAN
jgi:hypothetical protein